MTEIDSKTLKEGMLFSSPLLFDDGKNMFLPERMPITKYHLDTLQRWNIEKVIAYGKEITSADEGIDELESLEEVDSVDDTQLFSRYISSIQCIERAFKCYELGTAIDKGCLDESVKIIYALINEEKSFLAGISFAEVKNQKRQAINAVNIAILSAIIAMELKFSQKDILHLITAALLHDIDMLTQPDNIVKKMGKLTDEEFTQIKTHVHKAVALVIEKLSLSKEIAVIILQHHERWDGKGYPDGRSGQQINLASRVLSVADAFEAMVSDKTYRTALVAHDAVKALLQDKDTRFDPTVLKAFINCIGVYPVGSHVLLSDSSVAKIVEPNQAAPFFPSVIIRSSKNPALTPDTIIDLSEQDGLTILRPIKQSELSAYI